MLNLVREGEEDYIEAIRYRRRLKFFENFLFSLRAEHSDADRDITGIEGLLFRNRLNGGEKMVLKI